MNKMIKKFFYVHELQMPMLFCIVIINILAWGASLGITLRELARFEVKHAQVEYLTNKRILEKLDIDTNSWEMEVRDIMNGDRK